METINDILREVREYGNTPPPRGAWIDIADRIEAAHKAALDALSHKAAIVWCGLLDASEGRERDATRMFLNLKSAAQAYIQATCGMMGANAERVIRAREAVEEAMARND